MDAGCCLVLKREAYWVPVLAGSRRNGYGGAPTNRQSIRAAPFVGRRGRHTRRVMEGADLMMLTLGNDRRVQPVIQTEQIEQNGAITPDGRWLAYDSNDSGPSRIFVRPFPNANEGKAQVSTGGGSQPLWSRNGRELFYLSPDATLMGVSVEPGRKSIAGMPRSYSRARTLAESATVALARTMCRRTASVSSCSSR